MHVTEVLITEMESGLVLQPQGLERPETPSSGEPKVTGRVRNHSSSHYRPVAAVSLSTLFKKSGPVDVADQRVFSLKGSTDFVHKIQYPYKLCRSFTIHEEHVILLTQLAILARTLCTSITRVTRFDTTNAIHTQRSSIKRLVKIY